MWVWDEVGVVGMWGADDCISDCPALIRLRLLWALLSAACSIHPIRRPEEDLEGKCAFG